MALNAFLRFPEAVRTAAKAAHAAPSADNLQPVGFRFAEDALILCHRESTGPTFPPHHPATLLAVGAAVENVAQAAAAMEIPAAIVVAAETVGHYVRIDFGQAESTACSRVRSHALFNRHTNRHRYDTTPIPDALVARVAGFCENTSRIKLLRRPDEIRALAISTQIASEARFCTPEIHAWLVASLRLTAAAAAQGDGLDVRTLDLPPGGRHLLGYLADWRRMERLNRFGAYRLLAGIETRPIRQAPLLIAIIGREPMSAGRLMERAWIELNRQGLAVQPFYVIPDQMQRLQEGTVPPPLRESVRAMADDVHAILGLAGEETLQMVLRVGRPTRAPFRSMRLPLAHMVAADLV